MRAGAAALLGWAAAIGVATLLVTPQRLSPDLATLVRPIGMALFATALLLGVAAWRRATRRAAMVALAVACLLLPATTLPLLKKVAAQRSAHRFAAAITGACGDAPVVAVETLPTSLPFYLRRRVGLVSLSGNPFPSNYVRRHWPSLERVRDPSTPRFATSYGPLPERAVVVAERSDQGAAIWASAHAMEAIASDRRLVAYGRGCTARAPAR